jgi:hypothetical protein
VTETPQEVLDLVDRYKHSRETFESSAYLEASVRQEFIDPFFRALGWDVGNQHGWADQNKEVVVEPYLDIDGHYKAPDYAFRVGPQPQFFVEAKRPSIPLRIDPDPAKQIRTYGWNASMQACGLTNFGEFVVYDTSVKPAPDDKVTTARVKYISFLEYDESWEWLSSLFGHDAVWKGSLQEFAKVQPSRRGTEPVDVAILGEIERWRQTLAIELARKNPALSAADLNSAVQTTIDRILFLRICEDRNVQPYGDLRGATKTKDVYGELLRLFRLADAKYNSGLFHFAKESGRSSQVDVLTPNLDIGNRVLAALITDLYPPTSPFDFRFIGVEVLGHVYEQFLGKVIELTPDHKTRIEEKPEVKKAGGVVYTPQSVVTYITDATVGRALASQSIGIVSGRLGGKKAHPLRVLDPACGSGSFLMTVYQRLLDWYLEQYGADPEQHLKGRSPVLRPLGTNSWELTTPERKRILLDHIFGVDIDAQAVEVTKLSLLLKCLEGETEATIDQQMTFLQERALPDLENNIRCGNSLIGTDFTATDPSVTVDAFRMDKINMFDWSSEFSGVFSMDEPGFDIVLGNPPYVLLQDEFRDDLQLSYFRSHYGVAAYKIDTYHLFLERSLELTRVGGWMSMITPSNYLTNNNLAALRRMLLETSAVESVTIIDGSVFPARSVDCAIVTTRPKSKTNEPIEMLHAMPTPLGTLELTSQGSIQPERVLATPDFLFTGTANDEVVAAFDLMQSHGITLGDMARVHFGKQLRNRKVFKGDVINGFAATADVPSGYAPCYTGRDINRWSVEWSGIALLDNEVARMGGCWDPAIQEAKDKLITRQIGRRPEWGIDPEGYQCLNTVFMVKLKGETYAPLVLLGILNSSPLRAFWLDHFYDQRGTFPKVKGTYLKMLPLPPVPNPATATAIANAVSELMRLTTAISSASGTELQRLERGLVGQERELDRLVGNLYGLGGDQLAALQRATATTPR